MSLLKNIILIKLKNKIKSYLLFIFLLFKSYNLNKNFFEIMITQ